MLRFTRQADYAIVLMTNIAASARDSHTARELAVEAHLPLPMVSKILKVLTREGLLASQRGVKGGYRLAKRPAEVTVARLVAAMDGPIAMTECSGSEPRGCEHESFCRVRGNLQLITRAIHVALDNLTLANLASPCAPEPQLLTVQRAKTTSTTLETA